MGVEVTVKRELINQWGNVIHTANYVMRQLQAQGAPVGGGLFPVSVERGVVSISENAAGDLVVSWSEDGGSLWA